MRNILQCSSISLQGVLFSGFGFTVFPARQKDFQSFSRRLPSSAPNPAESVAEMDSTST